MTNPRGNLYLLNQEVYKIEMINKCLNISDVFNNKVELIVAIIIEAT